jgi:hypothetical protein
VLLAAAALVLAGCNYSYHNPADGLTAGEIGGKARAGTGPGIAVSVKGSLLDQAARPSGRFELVPLPRGAHTVLLRQGVSHAALREVDLGYGSDGRVEGVWLGQLDLPRAVALTGVFSGATGAESTYGVVVDEVTGMSLPSYGGIQLEAVAVGRHRLIVFTQDDVTGNTWIGGPVLVTAALSEQGTEKILSDVSLRATTTGTGHLYLRVSSMVSGLDPATAVVHVLDWTGNPVAVPTADSNGDRDLTLAEGAYFVEVLPPPAFAGTVSAPERRVAVVVADDAYDLGTFTLAEDATLEAAARACHDDSDCAPGTCLTGECTGGYTPAAVAPAALPLCADLQQCFNAPDPCGWPGALGGAATSASCVLNPVSTVGVCIPCSTRCTIDGVAVLSAPACSY